MFFSSLDSEYPSFFFQIREHLKSTYHDLWINHTAAARPVFISQIMQTASIFRDTNNDATQSNFTKQFTAHCSVNPHDPATSFPTKANEAVCTTASNSSEDASVNPESTKKNTTDAVAPQSPLGLDHRVFFELPSSFAETPDCLKVPELFHGFLETLQPLDIWEGFDLGVQEDMLMDEMYSSIVAVDSLTAEQHVSA